jgi:hypothetical protein
MKRKILVFALLLSLLITIIPTTVTTFGVSSAASPNTDWTLVTDARAMKAYPDLKEYVYQKNATMPPNGQYDKIGLHRLVKTGISPKGVIFMTNCPNWGTGEQRISNSATDNWTKYENFSQAIYFANRGYDVYAIDYRSHFIPTSLNASQVSFMMDWGWDVWISDIKEAAEKVKEVSGASKFFISGECTGATAALNYATKYASDLRGIILLDPQFNVLGYPVVATLGTETNTFNLTQVTIAAKTAGVYTTGGLGLGGATKVVSMYVLQNPGAPAQYPPGTPLTPTVNPLTNKTWANITEWYTYTIQYAMTGYPGAYANLMGGFGNVTQVEYCLSNSEFIPARLGAENMAIADWVNCPYVTFDFNDHYKEINVPVLAFATGLFSNRTGALRFVNGLNTNDFTTVMLKNYGHLDVYFGINSATDVSEPTYQWMVNHLLHTDPYTDPTAVAWNVDKSYSSMDLVKANHTYVPADKAANPVQKLTISLDEKLLTCNINVGGVTYSLGKDFTYTGHMEYIYYNPSFNNPTLGYLIPSGFSGSEATVNFMYNFSAVPGGLEGTLSMFATVKNDVSSVASVGGSGDFKNVEVKATISQYNDVANLVVNIYFDGMVSGWPKAVPAFMTTNYVVTYDQLTDYCVNVWGLPSNPYPVFPANASTSYHIFNMVIGDKFYLMVGCGMVTSGVLNPVAKTVAMTYNSTWYFGGSYKGIAKMDQGFRGTVVVNLLNYVPANATATPPTPMTYDIGPTVYNLKGFGALSGQSLTLIAEGQIGTLMPKGYALLP